ncbi:MAG TPA: hypothetical protein VFS21_02185 [Roseiflexaceae bacterium]|nr:hypothetical protein [Roseiflexaceae bacterium]
MSITWLEYTVPDQYEGFMALYYECPGGAPVERRDGRVHITFDNQGVACIKDRYGSVFPDLAKHVAEVRTTSGKPVRFAGGWEQVGTGYAMLDLTLRQSFGPNETKPDYMISVMWLGDMERLAEWSETGEYAEQQARFFEQKLGIPRDGRRPNFTRR